MLSIVQRQKRSIEKLAKKEKGKGESNVKRVKITYLKNFGKKHQRKKFKKTRENQPSQSQTGSKQMDLNNNKEGTIKFLGLWTTLSIT